MHTESLMSADTTSVPEVIVNVVIFSLHQNRLEVLLTLCGWETQSSQWCLPGSVPHRNESLETTALRELQRRSGLHEAYLEQLYTYGDPNRCPRARVISVVYFVLIPADAISSPFQDAEPGRWFPVDELPPLALDHTEMMAYALRRLRYKLEYSAVGFQLLPEAFTLSELQHTYEIILGEKIDKRNFRRRILEANIIEATQQMRSGEGRPARLYRYRPDAIAEVKARRLFP